MINETQLITIDNQLRLILFGLECALNVEFAVEVVERIFLDCTQDARNEKQYILWTEPRLSVVGLVEEYEPGDIWLTVKSVKAFSPSLPTTTERAKFQAYRLEKHNDSE